MLRVGPDRVAATTDSEPEPDGGDDGGAGGGAGEVGAGPVAGGRGRRLKGHNVLAVTVSPSLPRC